MLLYESLTQFFPVEDCPEEVLNRFHYEARTKILQQLCATFDETGFLEALKQLKL